MRRVHLESGLCETPGKLLTTTDPALVTCKRCLFPVSSRQAGPDLSLESVAQDILSLFDAGLTIDPMGPLHRRLRAALIVGNVALGDTVWSPDGLPEDSEATPISERVPDLLERPVSAEALYEQGLSSLRKARNLFTKVWGMQPEGDGLRLSASMVLDRIDRILEDE